MFEYVLRTTHAQSGDT